MLEPRPTILENALLSSSSPILVDRRGVISTLGLTATAFCATSLKSNAGWFGFGKNDIEVVEVKPSREKGSSSQSNVIGGFPEEWVQMQGRSLKAYAQYINSLKLNNISAQDVISAHAKKRGNVWNTLPPKKWWKRMGYTLRVVDRISSEMDVPVKEIISGYRCPNYNARCSGAKRKSWHQANVALDVKFDTSPRKVTAAARSLRDRGLFKGGVGGYSRFTHIDTRGTNVNW